jgi:hypothetical protein
VAVPSALFPHAKLKSMNESIIMNKVASRQATDKSKLTRDQIETLREAGYTAKQIAALPDILGLSSSQIDLAVEIGAIPDYEEVPLNEKVQLSEAEIDFSDIRQKLTLSCVPTWKHNCARKIDLLPQLTLTLFAPIPPTSGESFTNHNKAITLQRS